MPSHLYELLPIAVLIGTIFVMARLAQSSEYTILRTSGLGPWRALRTLLVLGAGLRACSPSPSATTWRRRPTAPRSCSRRAITGSITRRADRRLAEGEAARTTPTRSTWASLAARRQHAGRAHLRVRHPGLPGVASRRRRRRVSPTTAPGLLHGRRSAPSSYPRTRARRRHRSSVTSSVPSLALAHATSRPRWCRWRCSSPSA